MLQEWITGQRYFAVYCHLCGLQFAFAREEMELQGCPIRLTCCDCLGTDYYCAKEFVRVEAK